MANKRTLIKARGSSPPAKLTAAPTRANQMRRTTSRRRSAPYRGTPANDGFSMSITVSSTTIRYATWFLATVFVLAISWLAPDAAALAAKAKALCELLRLLK